MKLLRSTRKTKTAIAGVLTLLMVGVLPGTASAHSGGGETRDVHELLKTLKGATNHLKKVEDAVAAGYLPVSPCVEDATEGAMGIHYLNQNFLDHEIDPDHPEVLVFMPDEKGKSKLVAVEFLVVGHQVAPVIAGIEFDPGPFPGSHALHAWIYEKNPAGTFADYNPAISCPSS